MNILSHDHCRVATALVNMFLHASTFVCEEDRQFIDEFPIVPRGGGDSFSLTRGARFVFHLSHSSPAGTSTLVFLFVFVSSNSE